MKLSEKIYCIRLRAMYYELGLHKSTLGKRMFETRCMLEAKVNELRVEIQRAMPKGQPKRNCKGPMHQE